MSGISTGTVPARTSRRALSPFPEVIQLHNLLNSVFGSPALPAEQATGAWQPSVDIFETGDEIVLSLDLPGIKKENIQITINDQTLTITGERQLEFADQRDGYHRIERSYGQFARSFTVPPNVDREALRAEFTSGVLTLHLLKRQEAKPRQIAIE